MIKKASIAVIAMWISASACVWGAASPKDKNQRNQAAEATLYDYTRSRAFPDFFSAYSPPFVPQAKLANSSLLESLTSGGKLKLSLEDAIALSLENNLDIAVARYNLPIAQTDLLRARAGGATRGVAGAYQSSALFGGAIGTGVGGGGGGGGGNAGGALGGGVPSVGSSSCCDPEISINYGWGYTVTPLNYLVVTGVPIEDAHTNYLSATYSQGFLTGTSLIFNVFGARQATNATTQLFNPDITSNMTVGITQHLLNGFGRRANAKFIKIAENDQKYSASVFLQNVTDTVSKVMSNYYDLLADQENIHVAQDAMNYAQKLMADNKEEQKIGSIAQLDVAQSELAVANREQDLLLAENTFAQDSQSMKSLISKSFNGEIATVQIDPTDHLPEPHPNDIPPFAEALSEALKNRPEVQQAEMNLQNQRITIQAARNNLLPTLDAYAVFSPQGQAGSFGPAFSPLFHNRFPGYGYGVRLDVPIRNRQAEADAARALLEQRQLQMKLQQAKNLVVWDVSKDVALVHQAKGQLDAALRVTTLARQNFDMEHTKFTVGQATVGEVIDSQSQLATAENNEVKARAGYAKALIAFEEATGTVLKRNNIELSDAMKGEVPRQKLIPGDTP